MDYKDSLDKIEHLIILMMENRSFDHYLGSLSLPTEGRTDVEGLSNPLPTLKDENGNLVTSWPMDGIFDIPDLPHGWDHAHADYNGGANDGFVVQHQQVNKGTDPRIPMGYYTRATLPVLYKLADEFTVCDHWFGSVLSSTWPNRKYLHSGRRDEDNDTHNLPLPPGFKTTPLYNVLEDWNGPGGLLSWKCYVSDVPFLAFWYLFALNHVHNFTHVVDFVVDCQTDSLPTVSIIDPPFTLADDHPAHNPVLGQKFIGLIVDALTHSESWKESALVILYDENGGFYDHLRPEYCFETPPADDPTLGFRIPAIVVSPYARRGKVSKTVYDHTSIMRSIHTRWNVPFDPLTFGTRWEKAPDIWSDCFDFTQDPLPMGPYTGPPLRDVNWGGGIHERLTKLPEGFERLLERIFVLPELKSLDRRAQLFDTLVELEQRIITLRRIV